MSDKSNESIAFEDTLYEKTPSATPAPKEDTPPKPTIEKEAPSFYQDQKEFARGGLGRVLTAYDARLGRTVAIKELLQKHDNAELRFLQEARITARLEHPSIVPIYEVGHWPNGDPYYSMRLLPGEPLSQHIQKKEHLIDRLSLLPQVISVCQAIAYAHAKNIIHRDLKPHNVIIGEFGEAVVIDWGIAKEIVQSGKLTEDSEQKKDKEPAPSLSDFHSPLSTPDLTQAGAIIGTPAYMPPEQARGDDVDIRVDIYSLGAILYHLVTGQPPYAGIKTKSVLLLVQSQAPAELAALQPDVPAPLRSIIEKAMARDPKDRYPSAKSLAEDLTRFQSGRLVSAHSYSFVDRVSRFFDKHKTLVMSSAASLFLIFLVGVFSLLKIVQANKNEEAARIEAEKERDTATKERSIAEAQRDQIKKNALALLIEQGRSEVVNQNYQRALPILSAAYQETAPHSERALSFLLSEALQQVETKQQSLQGHDNPVSSIGFSPDGARLFTSSSDQKIIVWDALSSSQLKSFQAKSAAFLSSEELLLYVAEKGANRIELQSLSTETTSSWPIEGDASLVSFSPDGAYVAVINSTQLSVYNSRTAEKLSTPIEPSKNIVELKLTKTHAYFIDSTGTFYTWELSTGLITKTNIGLSSIMLADISSDGKAVAAYSFEGRGLLWRGAEDITPIVYSNQSSCLRFSPDGSLLAVADGKFFALYVHGVTKTIEAHSSIITSLSFSPDGHELLSTSTDGTTKRWNVESGLLLQTFSGQEAPIISAYFAPDQKTIFTTNREKEAVLWAVTPSPLSIKAAVTQGNIKTLRFSPDGSQLTFAGTDKKLSFMGVEERQISQEAQHTEAIACQDYSPSGEQLITIDTKGTALIWDASTKKPLQTINLEKSPLSVAFIDESEFAVVYEDGSVSYWDGKRGVLLSSVESRGKPLRATLSPKRTYFALVHTREIHLFLLKDKKFWADIGATCSSNLWFASFSPNEERIIALNFGNTADIFDLVQKRWMASISLGPQNFISAAYSPDNTLLATTSSEGILSLWDAQKNVLLASRRGALFLDGSVLAFSPDSSLLVSTTATSDLIFWRVLLEERAADKIREVAEKFSPWRLEDGHLVLN